MKIAILTLPLHTNYGGILQAYALQTILKDMGHEVCLIEKEKKPLSLPLYKMPYSYAKRILKRLIGINSPIFIERKINREQPLIRQYTDQFIRNYIKVSTYHDFTDIKENEYDAIIVGSDQVWRPKYFGGNQIEDAYLKFTKHWHIKRISYAASFGSDEWEYTQEQTDACLKLIKLFNAISFRERSGVELCNKYFKLKGQHVIDPTLLLNKEDYIRLFNNSNTPKSKGNLLYYILDETNDKKKVLETISKDIGLIPFNVKSKSDNINSPLYERIQPPLEQWIRGFFDADYIFTDSFHACVFSIIFNKPFIVYGNANRGLTRFKSLLNIFELNDCLIIDSKQYKSYMHFDWDRVNHILEIQREKAKSFLITSLR